MTNQDKWITLFRLNPKLRFNRPQAYLEMIIKYYGGNHIFVLNKNLYKFLRDFAGIERSCREVLNQPEFALPPEQDLKRREKQEEFRKEWKPEGEKDRERYEKIFGKTCYYCGKDVVDPVQIRVLESPKDVECSPKTWVCRECYNKYMREEEL